jgi:hypothetical protein
VTPEQASDQIFALVSGFPPKARRQRRILFLQAFIDDSGVGQPPVSVLSGFLAPAEKWAAFSAEWQEVLDMRPSIAYLKMSEAEACAGEFAHWSAERRDERIALFFSLIERHASVAATCAVPHDMYEKVFRGRVPKEHHFIEHPYFILFYGIVHSIAHHFQREGRNEPIDFIFDTQTEQMKRIFQTWDGMQKFSAPAIRPLVANPPIFRNDKTTLPLQAADLHAWWTHRTMTAYFTGQPMRRPPLPGKKEALAIPALEMLWTEERLKRMRRSLMPYVSYKEPLQISGQFQQPWRVSVTTGQSS